MPTELVAHHRISQRVRCDHHTWLQFISFLDEGESRKDGEDALIDLKGAYIKIFSRVYMYNNLKAYHQQTLPFPPLLSYFSFRASISP